MFGFSRGQSCLWQKRQSREREKREKERERERERQEREREREKREREREARRYTPLDVMPLLNEEREALARALGTMLRA